MDFNKISELVEEATSIVWHLDGDPKEVDKAVTIIEKLGSMLCKLEEERQSGPSEYQETARDGWASYIRR